MNALGWTVRRRSDIVGDTDTRAKAVIDDGALIIGAAMAAILLIAAAVCAAIGIATGLCALYDKAVERGFPRTERK